LDFDDKQKVENKEAQISFKKYFNNILVKLTDYSIENNKVVQV